jgi:hypothetical protein
MRSAQMAADWPLDGGIVQIWDTFGGWRWKSAQGRLTRRAVASAAASILLSGSW